MVLNIYQKMGILYLVFFHL